MFRPRISSISPRPSLLLLLPSKSNYAQHDIVLEDLAPLFTASIHHSSAAAVACSCGVAFWFLATNQHVLEWFSWFLNSTHTTQDINEKRRRPSQAESDMVHSAANQSFGCSFKRRSHYATVCFAILPPSIHHSSVATRPPFVIKQSAPGFPLKRKIDLLGEEDGGEGG